MFLKRLGVVGLLLAGLAATAQAAERAKKDQPAKPQRGDDIICTYEQPVGTHIKRRTCATRAERQERARRDQEALQRMRGPGTQQRTGATGD